VAAIVPAYNEERGIARILDVLCQCDILKEIIVVDDGSFDHTGEVVERYRQADSRLRLIHNDNNLGKGQAVYSGFQSTSANCILTIDADLIGLKPQHVIDLARPVLENETDMTLGVFRGGQFHTDFAHWVTPWLTGQRCIRAGFFRQVSWQAAAGYGLETAITVAAQINGWRCQPVKWRGVSHPPSEFHRGVIYGIVTRFKMYAQILRAWVVALKDERAKARSRKPFWDYFHF